MTSGIKKAIHISGVICGLAAGIGLIVAGIMGAANHTAGQVAPGKLICLGLAGLAATIVAIIDGARAFPKLGIWEVGAKFEGLNDLATITIFLIVGAGIGVSFAFN